ncbi:MAG TPA: hypothetical protein VGD98_14635 [Ktedonobacteraceae bacterium]
MDFDLDTYRPLILDALLKGDLEAVEITKLGAGESNLILYIALDEQEPLTIRLAWREDTADQLLPSEFHLLQRLPEGLGPRVCAGYVA